MPLSLRIATAGAVVAFAGLPPLSTFAQAEPAASCDLPVLDLANPSPGAMLSAGAYVVEGRALDPQAAQGSGVDQVSFFLGPRDEGGMSLGDVAPSSGEHDAMFSTTVTLPTTMVGEHQFVAYAHSALTGKETEVSLPIVLGEDPAKAELTPADTMEESTNPGAVPVTCQNSAPAPGVLSPVPAVATPVPAIVPEPEPIAETPACENCNSDVGQ